MVSLALIAAICIGEVFSAGEIAFIMQLGTLLEDLTVAKAREEICIRFKKAILFWDCLFLLI